MTGYEPRETVLLAECTGVLHSCFFAVIGLFLYEVGNENGLLLIACNIKDRRSIRERKIREKIDEIQYCCGAGIRGGCMYERYECSDTCRELAGKLCNESAESVKIMLELLEHSLAEVSDAFKNSSYQILLEITTSRHALPGIVRDGQEYCIRNVCRALACSCVFVEYTCREHGRKLGRVLEGLKSRCFAGGRAGTPLVGALEDAEKWLVHGILDAKQYNPRYFIVATHDYGVYEFLKYEHCRSALAINTFALQEVIYYECKDKPDMREAENCCGHAALHLLQLLLFPGPPVEE